MSRNTEDSLSQAVIGFVVLIVLGIMMLFTGCTNENDARKALQSQGFTEVQVTGYKWFACSEDDWYHTGFVAKNGKGEFVEGTVCSGLFFKNSTVRW